MSRFNSPLKELCELIKEKGGQAYYELGKSLWRIALDPEGKLIEAQADNENWNYHNDKLSYLTLLNIKTYYLKIKVQEEEEYGRNLERRLMLELCKDKEIQEFLRLDIPVPPWYYL